MTELDELEQSREFLLNEYDELETRYKEQVAQLEDIRDEVLNMSPTYLRSAGRQLGDIADELETIEDRKEEVEQELQHLEGQIYQAEEMEAINER